MTNKTVIRVPEWSQETISNLSSQQRTQIQECVERWTVENSLTTPPVSFSGPKGDILTTSNFVGVVEAAGQAIEIYPKLDRVLLQDGQALDSDRQKSTMASLLWMLEVASHEDIFDADTSSLETSPSNFLDLWAALLGRNLHKELQFGLARAYRPVEDNATTVRGRILFHEQLLHNANRPDRIYCGWDEFTEDRPLNRILKCACRFLSGYVQNPDTQRLLFDCIAIFEEVEDIDAATALRQVDRIIWDRSMQRFKLPFRLAVRLLQSVGHEAFHGGPQTYVFLLDMNQVFEDYVGAILSREHQVPVDSQYRIGTLFVAPKRIQQKPDYYWQDKHGNAFIADAKYKPFFDWHQAPQESEFQSGYFNVQDIRQLICYGLMAPAPPERVHLQLVYPFVGEGPLPPAITKNTFTRMPLTAVPIRATRPQLPDEPLIGCHPHFPAVSSSGTF